METTLRQCVPLSCNHRLSTQTFCSNQVNMSSRLCSESEAFASDSQQRFEDMPTMKLVDNEEALGEII